MLTAFRGARRIFAVKAITRKTRLEAIGISRGSSSSSGECVERERLLIDHLDLGALRSSWQLGECQGHSPTCRPLRRRKGHDIVLRALPQILQSVPQAIYVIGGTGPEEGSLRLLAHELGLDRSVRFLGHVAD